MAKLSPKRLALAVLRLVLVSTSPATHPQPPTPEKVVKQQGTQQNGLCKTCITCLVQVSRA